MPFETARVLIWGKTYPELSQKYRETVCTGGCREDGRPIRLYPVPFRYQKDANYQLYDWIELEIEKSTQDPRPESFKVKTGSIRKVGHLDTRDNWELRRQVLFRDPSWQFPSLGALEAEQMATRRSMGIVRPGTIEKVELERRPPQDEREFRAKFDQLKSELDLFGREQKDLEFVPYRIKIRWRCSDTKGCRCADRPHGHSVLDWGLLELGRRDGFEKAREQMERITRRDFHIIAGNFKSRPKQFGIIALWYPLIDLQEKLF